ncbi:hypothetical protein Btru_010500 [Bulinus truncatus]|nr:hypothetical protein Btru_010500 [Bulinus truncatus]
MSALFNFQSLLTVVLLMICTCAYLRAIAPSLMDRNKTGLVVSPRLTRIFSSFTKISFLIIFISQTSGHILEICTNRREEESICSILLCSYGIQHFIFDVTSESN